MNSNLENVCECYNCGLFIDLEQSTNKNIKYKCPRCHSKIQFESKHSFDSLYYAISSLLLFALLNIYPLLTLFVNDMPLKATLIDTIMILLKQDFFFVAMIVFFTIFLAPVLNSLVIIFSFIQIHTRFKPFSETLLHDSFHFFKDWGFIEVFVVSIIVTYIKLSGMVANTKFDIGFYIMLAYVLCFYMSNIKFENKKVFE